jgi:2-polyprenyl-3-methyl-5-hydroxy-6-metoxy-1,4-benzoquinol methylase
MSGVSFVVSWFYAHTPGDYRRRIIRRRITEYDAVGIASVITRPAIGSSLLECAWTVCVDVFRHHVAEIVRAGDTVLDVGCGEGGLARHLPHATYVGLDTYSDAIGTEPDIRNEAISQHAVSHPEEYNMVCALHTIEHVPDPLGFARDLATCIRPGGHLCIVVPSRGSAITEIPNFVLNAPPHHLSWWNEDALRALADRLDLMPEAIEAARAPARGFLM